MNTFRGPNQFSRFPVMVTALDASALPRRGTAEDIETRLRQHWPAWLEGCPPLGTLQRNHALGMLLAYWARGLLNSVRGVVEGAGAMQAAHDNVLVWVGYHKPELTARAIRIATDIVNAAATAGEFPDPALEQRMTRLQAVCRQEHPDYIARILMLAARARDIPVLNAPAGERFWQYGWGNRSRVFFEATPDSDGYMGTHIARSKAVTARFLQQLGFPHAEHGMAQKLEQAQKIAARIGWPVVVKPVDGSQGRGVTVGISSGKMLQRAFGEAMRYTQGGVLVERFVEGTDYRLFVVRGKLVAATRREPASVTGDGKSTLRELIDRLNRFRAEDPILARYLKQTLPEPAVTEHIERQGLTFESVIADGRRVFLRSNANVSTGGTPSDVLAEVHPAVRAMAEAIAVNGGYECAGIDYITTDISKSWQEVPACVIEINTTPGLDLHVATGTPEEEIGRIVLGPVPGRIPVAVVVASPENLKKLFAQIYSELKRFQPGTAFMGPEMSLIGGQRFGRGKRDMPDRVAQVLTSRLTTAAIIGATPEQITLHGFPVDKSPLTVAHRDSSIPVTVADTIRRNSADVLEIPAGGGWPGDGLVETLASHLRGTRVAAPALAPANHADALGLTQVKEHKQTKGPTLFTMMKNEEYFAPFFFDHYRALGVENFLVYDDHSTDGTLDYLTAQPDCTVLTSGRPFNDRMPDGLAYHQFLKRSVPYRAGEGKWVVTVDADEFMFLPSPFANLPQLYKELDKRGHACLLASMVDFYPRKLSERNYAPELSPFDGCPYFDAERSFFRPPDGERIQKTFGGVRPRMQGLLRERAPDTYDAIYKDKGYLMAALWKTPLIKTGGGVWLLDSHSSNACPPFDIELALAHFKFYPSLDGKIAEALSDNRYYLGSIEYRFLKAVIDLAGDEDLLFEKSRKFEGAKSLEEAGFTFCRPET